MTIDQLRYVLTVAKCLSFSEASEKLFVSQSAISQSISRLEENLNLKLFDRTTKNVSLSKEGKLALPIIKGLLEKANELNQLSKRMRQKQSIKVAIIEGLYLPFMLKLLTEQLANLPIHIEENTPREIIKDIRFGQIDFGILPIYEENMQDLQSMHISSLIDISYYVFVSKKSKLANYKKLSLSDLVDQQITLYQGPFLQWSFKHFQKENEKLNLLFTSVNQEFIREFTRDNLGISIDTISEIIVNPYVKKGQTIAIPLELAKRPKSYLGLIANEDNIDLVTFDEMYKIVLKYVEEEVKEIKNKLV